MSEEKIVVVVNEALASAGIEDTVTAAGEFEPRGHSGAGFAGGRIGGDIGDAIGSPVGGIGAAGGYLAGTRAHDAASGLPERMVVGVSRRRSTDSRATAPTHRLSSSTCPAGGSRRRSTSA